MGGGYIKVFLGLGVIVLIASSFNVSTHEGMDIQGQVGENKAHIQTLLAEMKRVNAQQIKSINQRLTDVEESINDILESQAGDMNAVIDNSEERDDA